MKVGIIGSGSIGGTLGRHLAKAGYEVFFSSRHPDQLDSLVKEAGENANRGTVSEAASFGEFIVLAVPFKAIKDVAEKTEALEGKTIIDTTNPFPTRDGIMVRELSESSKTASEYVAGYFPYAHLVKAFNTIYYKHLQEQAFREGGHRAIPYAGDHDPSLTVVDKLIQNIGFGAVYIGKLSESRIMEPGQPLFTNDLTVEELEQVLEEL